jgi:hypothetical protein
VFGRTSHSAGDDTAAFEQDLREHAPKWMPLDMRLMGDRFLTKGMLPDDGDVDRLVAMLGRPLRSYRDFAIEITATP